LIITHIKGEINFFIFYFVLSTIIKKKKISHFILDIIIKYNLIKKYCDHDMNYKIRSKRIKKINHFILYIIIKYNFIFIFFFILSFLFLFFYFFYFETIIKHYISIVIMIGIIKLVVVEITTRFHFISRKLT